MPTSDPFCLKWNDFQENSSTAFGSMRMDSDLVDITLVCEDGQQVEAHKVILAMSSPFFRNLFKKNKHPHPLIYMRGLKADDLVALIDFLYFGEANIYEENMETFMKIAEDLNLQGFTKEDVITKQTKVFSKKHSSTVQMNTQNNKTETVVQNYEKGLENYFVKDNSIGNMVLPTHNNVSYSNIQDLDLKVRSLMVRGANNFFVCQCCEKEGISPTIRDHIESNHIDSISIPCNLCDKLFSSRASLRNHSRKHKQKLDNEME